MNVVGREADISQLWPKIFFGPSKLGVDLIVSIMLLSRSFTMCSHQPVWIHKCTFWVLEFIITYLVNARTNLSNLQDKIWKHQTLFFQNTIVRHIRQFHYTTWPDMNIPDYAGPIIDFRMVIRQYWPNTPLIVHCRFVLQQCNIGN